MNTAPSSIDCVLAFCRNSVADIARHINAGDRARAEACQRMLLAYAEAAAICYEHHFTKTAQA